MDKLGLEGSKQVKRGQKGVKMTPNPRSTPKRSKIVIKIFINFDENPKGRGRGLGLVVWGRDPPLGAPGRAPGAQGRRPRPHGTALPGTQVRVLNIKS